MLKNELKRLTNVMNHPNDLRTHSRSVSNASSQNEEDFGYNSGKNTLEIKKSYEGDLNNNSNINHKHYSNNKYPFVEYDRTYGTPESFSKLRGKLLSMSVG